MTYGTFANTYLVGRRPSRSSPHRRSRSVRSARTGDPAHGKGTYSTHGALCALLFGLPCSKTSRPRDQLRLRSRKTSHPPRQDAQINYLAILAIFVKQRTYLATLLFIWPSCPYLAILPCPIAPPRQRNSKKTKRNLFCTTPLRSRGLSSLTSLSSHFFYRQHNPGEFLNPDDLGGTTWGGTDHP
jgi:hypothetical protein